MNQEIDNDEITIDLTELFMALWSRLHIILMAGVLGALIATRFAEERAGAELPRVFI